MIGPDSDPLVAQVHTMVVMAVMVLTMLTNDLYRTGACRHSCMHPRIYVRVRVFACAALKPSDKVKQQITQHID